MGQRFLFISLIIVFQASLLFAQKMTVKDSDSHVLMNVNDEGTMGSITLPDTSAALSSQTNKLYNLNGSLIWNGSALGMSGSAGGWTDDGTNVRLTSGTDKVGIGTSTPSAKLTIQNTITGDWNQMLDILAPSADDDIHTAGIHFGRAMTTNEAGALYFVPSATAYKGRISMCIWGYNDLLNIEGTGNVGIGITNPAEVLEVNGAIKLDNTSNTNTGTIRWSGSDFEGYNGSAWQSFTSGGGGASDINGLSDGKTGGNSVFLGSGAGASDDGSDNRNSAVGKDALNSNTTGEYNTASGYKALLSNTTGGGNTASGYEALYSNTIGFSNTASGYQALYSNTTGSYNTASGWGALFSNTSGGANTASGYEALYSNTTGNYNTASGCLALYSNTEGEYNTASGYEALYSNTFGAYNTASGCHALYSNTTGYRNTASGYRALYYNTIGVGNTASGTSALWSNTEGEYNTASGYQALYSNTDGNDNTASGYQALYLNTTGYRNTASGHRALRTNTTGYGNTALGYGADVSTGNLSNATAIGYDAEVNASNKVVIGNSSVGSIGGYANWLNYSDRRYKENIEYRDDLGLDFIMKLNTVSFNYKDDENKRRRDGLIAQDVEAALNELGIEFSGLIVDDDAQKTMNLSYGQFVLPLINAVKEQQQRIAELEKRIEYLEK